MKRQVLACGFGLLHPRTWSGTYEKVGAGLRDLGMLAGSLDTSKYAPRPVRAAAHWINQIYYANAREFARGWPGRRVRAFALRDVYRRSGATAVLHVGVFHHLPVWRLDPGIDHYLVADATWDTWSSGPHRAQYSARLVRDVEWMERETFAQMKHVFPISEHLRDNLISHYGVEPTRVTAVGTGLGGMAPYHGPKTYDGAGTILFIAKERLQDKGLTLLVEAFKLAQARRGDLRLILVIPPEYFGVAAGVPNVEVHARVPAEQLADFFRRATLFALPAHREPWGLVYLEALSCRVPILGLNRGAVPEFTQHGKYGFVVTDETPAGVADALLKAHERPEELERMGTEGQRWCLERYGWDRMVQRIADVINRDGEMSQASAPPPREG